MCRREIRSDGVVSAGPACWKLPRLQPLTPLADSQARPSERNMDSHSTVDSDIDSNSEGTIELEPRFGHLLAGDVMCRTPTDSRAQLQHKSHKAAVNSRRRTSQPANAPASFSLSVDWQKRASTGDRFLQQCERTTTGQQPVLLRIRPVCKQSKARACMGSNEPTNTRAHPRQDRATSIGGLAAGGPADRGALLGSSRSGSACSGLCEGDSDSQHDLPSLCISSADGAYCEPFPSMVHDAGPCRITLACSPCTCAANCKCKSSD